MPKFPFKSALSLLSAALLSACSLVKYQPVAGIDTVDLQRGYRFETSRLQHHDEDDTLIVLMFSGGGTRAAAFPTPKLPTPSRQTSVFHVQPAPPGLA